MAVKFSAKDVKRILANNQFSITRTALEMDVNLDELMAYIGSPKYLPELSELVLEGKAVAKITLLNLMVGEEVGDAVKNTATKMFLESFDDTVENVKTIKVENLSGDELANYYADLMK